MSTRTITPKNIPFLSKQNKVDKKESKFEKKVLKVVKGIAEIKYFDSNVGSFSDLEQIPVYGANPAASSWFCNLVAVPQGDTDLTRNGDRINPIRLDISAYFRDVVPYTTATNVQIVRVTVFMWMPNTAQLLPTAAQLFSSNVASYTVISPFNNDNLRGGVFEVLHDSTFDIDTYHPSCHFFKSIKFKPNEYMQFDSASVNGTRQIIWRVCSTNAQSTGLLTGIYNARFWYSDI